MNPLRNFRNISLTILFVQFAQITAASSASYAATGQEVLDRLAIPMQEIGSDARTARKWSGGILLGMGVALMGASPFVNQESASYLGGGVLLGALGGLILELPTEYEKLPDEFAQMPSSTPEERNAKAAKGEAYLARLGERSKNDRITGGVVLIGLGVASLMMASSIDDGGYLGINSTIRSVYLYEGMLFAGIGAAHLLSENGPERGNRLYREWKQEGRGTTVSMTGIGIVPARGGVAIGPRWSF